MTACPASSPTAAPAWLPLTALHAVPVTARQLARQAERLARSGQARKIGGGWQFAPTADLCGRTAAAWAATASGASEPAFRGTSAPDLPTGHESWSERDRQRYLDTRLLVRAFEVFRRGHHSSHATLAAAFAAANARAHLGDAKIHPETTVAQWCAQRGLKCTPERLRTYARRLRRDGNVDRRGRGRGRTPAPDARLTAAFLDRVLHQNQFSAAAAWRDVRDLALDLDVACPGLRWWQVWYQRQVPAHAKGYGRRRGKEFEAHELPKIHRTYGDLAPLDWISLDGHTLNILCRVPDARRGWRSARPTLTAVLDIRTRTFVGWDIRGTENSDGILAGLKMMHRAYGCARHYYADNGEAYKASVGSRVRREYFDDPRIGGLCAQTGAERHNAVPYHGWAKMIESIWNHVVRDFERYWESWWGNAPHNRPETAEKLRMDQLPTVDEITAGWREYLPVYHATEQFGDGMLGLTPTLALEQFRTEVRKLDPGVLDFLCCRLTGPRVVTADGIKLNNIRYGHFDVDVWKLKGRKVWVRMDPEQADYVWLCEEDGAPLCKASNRTLTGATPEEVREAARVRAQMRKIAREYHAARDFLLDSNIQQIMKTKRRHAEARQAAARAQLPPAAEPAVTLVRPDLVTAVADVNRKARREALSRTHGTSVEPDSKTVRNLDEVRAALADVTLREPDAPYVNPADRLGDFLDVG